MPWPGAVAVFDLEVAVRQRAARRSAARADRTSVGVGSHRDEVAAVVHVRREHRRLRRAQVELSPRMTTSWVGEHTGCHVRDVGDAELVQALGAEDLAVVAAERIARCSSTTRIGPPGPSSAGGAAVTKLHDTSAASGFVVHVGDAGSSAAGPSRCTSRTARVGARGRQDGRVRPRVVARPTRDRRAAPASRSSNVDVATVAGSSASSNVAPHRVCERDTVRRGRGRRARRHDRRRRVGAGREHDVDPVVAPR